MKIYDSVCEVQSIPSQQLLRPSPARVILPSFLVRPPRADATLSQVNIGGDAQGILCHKGSWIEFANAGPAPLSLAGFFIYPGTPDYTNVKAFDIGGNCASASPLPAGGFFIACEEGNSLGAPCSFTNWGSMSNRDVYIGYGPSAAAAVTVSTTTLGNDDGSNIMARFLDYTGAFIERSNTVMTQGMANYPQARIAALTLFVVHPTSSSGCGC